MLARILLAALEVPGFQNMIPTD